MEIIKHEGHAVLRHSSMDDTIRLAQSFALSDYFSDLKGDPKKKAAQAVTKIITGRELGVPEAASIRGINIIKGKPAISAGLMSGLIKGSGKYRYKVIDATKQRCEIACYERVDGKWESCGPNVVWDMQKAKEAQLTGKENWKKHADDMLFARCISQCMRRYFPDLLLGSVYTPEELEDVQDVEYQEVHIQPVTEDKGAITHELYKEPEQAPPLSEKEKFEACMQLIDKARGKSPDVMYTALTKVEQRLDQFSGKHLGELQTMIAEERSKLPQDLQPNEAKEAILAEAPPEFFDSEEPRVEEAPAELFDGKGIPV